MRLNSGSRRLCLLSLEDLLPLIGIGGGDPSVASAGRDAAIHMSSRQAAHQLGAQSAVFPLPSPRSLMSRVRSVGVVIVKLLVVIVRTTTALPVPSGGATWVERMPTVGGTMTQRRVHSPSPQQGRRVNVQHRSTPHAL